MGDAILSTGALLPSPGVSGPGRQHDPTQRLARLFQQIDNGNTDSITKAQFEAAFQNLRLPPSLKAQGADAVFSQLDPNGTGSVTQQDFVSGMKNIFGQLHAQRGVGHRGGSHGGGGADQDATNGTSNVTSGQGASSTGQLLLAALIGQVTAKSTGASGAGATDSDGDNDASGAAKGVQGASISVEAALAQLSVQSGGVSGNASVTLSALVEQLNSSTQSGAADGTATLLQILSALNQQGTGNPSSLISKLLNQYASSGSQTTGTAVNTTS